VEFEGLYLVHQNLPGRRVGSYRRKEHLVFIPLQGEIRVTVSDLPLRCGVGRMVYLAPDTVHAFASSGSQGERLICLIDEERWVGNTGAKSVGATVFPASQLCKELLFYLLLHPRTRAADPMIDVLVQTLGESLDAAQGLLQVEHLEGKSQDARVRAAMAYLRRNLGRSVLIGEAAAHAGLSSRTLHRLFLKEFGLTPRRVLALLRVSMARELLASGRFSVTEAAWEVGYRSLSQFIAVFRQVTGQLPSEFARYGATGGQA
jgi:AraC-like DNA-binding protein/quercetin dioxygenase-like cupin family protein